MNNIIIDPFERAKIGDSDYFQGVDLNVILNARDNDRASLLSVAAKNCHLSCCQVIYARCPRLLYVVKGNRNTPLHEAAIAGGNEVIKFLLTPNAKLGEQETVDYKLLMSVNEDKFTALHYAATYGHLESANTLIEAAPGNSFLGMVNWSGQTALHLAVKSQCLEIVQLLVKAAPDFDSSIENSRPCPLFLAWEMAISGDQIAAEIRNHLIKEQPTQCMQRTGVKSWTLLHHATVKGDLDTVKEIIDFCPDFCDWVDLDGQNFLHVAVLFGKFNVVEFVMQITYFPQHVLNAQDKGGNTPLHVAMLSGYRDICLELLRNYRVSTAIKNKEGVTALQMQLENEKYHILQRASQGDADFLSEIQVDVLRNSRDEDGETILSTAARNGHLKCCKVIASTSRCPELLYQVNKNGVGILHTAASNGKDELVKFLLDARHKKGGETTDYGLIMMVVSGNQRTALHLAVEGGHLQSVKLLIKADPSNKLLRMEDLYKDTPMHMAVRGNHLEIVKLLVDAHPDFVYSTNNVGSTPLLLAMQEASSGDPIAEELRKLLIKRHATQCRIPTGSNKWSLLHHATYKGDLSAIKEILDFAPECRDLVDKEGQNFLHVAAKFDQVNVVMYILESKIIPENTLNRKDDYGNTPLHVAVSCGNQGIAFALRDDLIVDKSAVNKEGRKASNVGPSVLFQCASNGDMDFFRVIKVDVLLKSKDENGDSLLSTVVRNGHLNCCEVISKKCPDLLHQRNNNGVTTLHTAASNGKGEIIKLLLRARSKSELEEGVQNIGSEDREKEIDYDLLMMVSNNQRTALHYAVDNDDLISAQSLIEADTTKKLLGMLDNHTETALHYAVKKHNFKIVKLLVEAYPNFECSASNTPFVVAVQEALSGDHITVKIRNFLIKKQSDQCKVRTVGNGWTLLHRATSENDLNAVREIIHYCPECLELVDNNEQNFLHLAAWYGHDRIIRYIVGLPNNNISKSVLNREDANGETPLHIAISRGSQDIVLSLLYDHRVDKDIMDKQGTSALKAINFYYDKRRAGVLGRTDLWDEKELKEQGNFDLLVGALIATVSFTAGITVPGGYIDGGANEGNAILYKKKSFQTFVVANTIALALSLFAVFSHFCMRRLADEKHMIKQLKVAAYCSIGALFAMMVAFIAGSYAVLSISNGLALTVLVICCCFFVSVFYSMWVMKRQQKPKTPPSKVDSNNYLSQV